MVKNIAFLALLIHSFGTKASNGSPKGNPSAFYNSRLTPAVISKFYGELQYGTALLSWKTYGGELNSQFFIERSENGKDFETISVADSISTTDGLNFQYKDTRPFPTGFYRIKAVQADTVYSDILRLSTISGMPDIKVSPDVFDALITVEVNSKINEEFTISLANSKGKVLSSRLVNAAKGNNKIIFDDGISFLYADEYTMSVTAVKYSYSQKLYKK